MHRDAGHQPLQPPGFAVGRVEVGVGESRRLLRDAKLYEIGAGTSEIRRMLIGRELFRETA